MLQRGRSLVKYHIYHINPAFRLIPPALAHLIGGGLSKYGIGLQCRSRRHTQTHHEKIVSPVRRGRVVGMRWTRKSTHSARHEHTQSCQFAGLACHSHACLWTQRTIIYPKRPWSRRLDDATSFSRTIRRDRVQPAIARCCRGRGKKRSVRVKKINSHRPLRPIDQI